MNLSCLSACGESIEKCQDFCPVSETLSSWKLSSILSSKGSSKRNFSILRKTALITSNNSWLFFMITSSLSAKNRNNLVSLGIVNILSSDVLVKNLRKLSRKTHRSSMTKNSTYNTLITNLPRTTN